MKNENLIIMAVLILLIAGALIFVIHKLTGKNRDRRKKYQNQRNHILVQNGVDVKKQMLGSGKGEYFSGNLEEYDTSYINGPSYSTWRISFLNLGTGGMTQYRFRKQMWLGRIPPQQQGEVRLVLEDARVSKKHCVIYEGEGRLCLSDENSKNHTYVNGIKAERPVFLNNGDIIKVGNTRLKIEFGK